MYYALVGDVGQIIIYNYYLPREMVPFKKNYTFIVRNFKPVCSVLKCLNHIVDNKIYY